MGPVKRDKPVLWSLRQLFFEMIVVVGLAGGAWAVAAAVILQTVGTVYYYYYIYECSCFMASCQSAGYLTIIYVG